MNNKVVYLFDYLNKFNEEVNAFRPWYVKLLLRAKKYLLE